MLHQCAQLSILRCNDVPARGHGLQKPVEAEQALCCRAMPKPLLTTIRLRLTDLTMHAVGPEDTRDAPMLGRVWGRGLWERSCLPAIQDPDAGQHSQGQVAMEQTPYPRLCHTWLVRLPIAEESASATGAAILMQMKRMLDDDKSP